MGFAEVGCCQETTLTLCCNQTTPQACFPLPTLPMPSCICCTRLALAPHDRRSLLHKYGVLFTPAIGVLGLCSPNPVAVPLAAEWRRAVGLAR